MDLDQLAAALAAPFEPSEVHFKPGAVSGNRALALAYVDARVVQDRLDEVLGVTGWEDAYKLLLGGSVVCKLTLHLGKVRLSKMDVGSPSEQPDEGDRMKAAFSDALKRAAVKFGVGRYLYRLPGQWLDYDPSKRQFSKTPALPTWALPTPKAAPVDPKLRAQSLKVLQGAAKEGVQSLNAAWKTLSTEAQRACQDPGKTGCPQSLKDSALEVNDHAAASV